MYQKTTQMKIAGVFLIDFGSAQLGDCNLEIVYKMALKWHENGTDVTCYFYLLQSLWQYIDRRIQLPFLLSLFFTKIENFFSLKIRVTSVAQLVQKQHDHL